MNKCSNFAFVAAVVAIGGLSWPVLAAQSRHWPNGRNAYAMVPHEDLYSSRLNGGGSFGSNAAEKLH